VGASVSKKQGDGYDFSEIVPYIIGEDARKIDWKSTARTGEPHIKLFYEEKEVTIALCALMSGSLLFEKKKAVLLHLFTELGLQVLKGNNLLTPIMIAQDENLFLPPSKKSAAIPHFIKKCDGLKLQNSTLEKIDIAKEINRHLKKRSFISGEFGLSINPAHLNSFILFAKIEPFLNKIIITPL